MKLVIPCRIVLLALALLAITHDSFARPEFYVRPIAQYTWLPTAYRKSSAKHNEIFDAYAGSGSVASRNYTASSDSLGGGLSTGIILGKERSAEIGVEAAITRFDGSYTTPEFNYYPGPPPTTAYKPATTQKCSFSVRTILASFRWNYGKNANVVRPFLGLAIGSIEYEITETERPPGFKNTPPFDGSMGNIALAAGGGVNFRLGRHADIEVGYRLLHSTFSLFNDDRFYQFAHVLQLKLGARF